jgi:hypothetical protein
MNKEHTTRDGTKMLISEMSDSHLRNTIKLLERVAKQGVEVVTESGGFDLEDIWFITEIRYGQDVLDLLNYAAYMAEADRRATLEVKNE